MIGCGFFVVIGLLLLGGCANSLERVRLAPSDRAPDFQLDLLDRAIDVFLPRDGVAPDQPGSLLIHLHGAAFIPAEAANASGREYVVAVVNLGAGSSRYENPFTPDATFARLIKAVSDSLARRTSTRTRIGSVWITSWSAGYGAVRAILRDPENVERIDGLLLLDGLHEDYDPAGALVPGGSRIDTSGMQPFLAFARRAVEGNAPMLVTHSAIVPGTYASTTETADYLIQRLGLVRAGKDRMLPTGMHQQSEALGGRFRVMGYPGETAADHIDHIHSLPAFLRILQAM